MPPPEEPGYTSHQLLSMLSGLGHALLATGDTVAYVEDTVRRIAHAYGADHVNVVALPTALFVKFGEGDSARSDFTSQEGLALRFDQIDAVFALAERAQRREILPQEAIGRLGAILASPPLYSVPLRIAGHVLLTTGLALILQPRPGVVGAAAGFGAVVGGLKIAARNRGLFQTLLPTAAAFIVAAIALLAAKHGFPASPMPVLVASLATFLPGGLLAVAVMELAYGDVVSGGSRFVTGLAQLLFLALGMLAATSLIGLPPGQLFGPLSEERLGAWAPWLGVMLFAIGHALHYSMPLKQLPWLFIVLAVAQIGQATGGAAFGGYMGGFSGALAMTAVAYFIQHQWSGPPAVVTFPPGLWLLVPGSLGLIGLTELVSTDRLAGIDAFVSTVFTITSIALGAMVGLGLYNALFDPMFARARSLADAVAKHGPWRR
ncbi:MAG TPA: threonine/serine exporter family protein [Casimicrobiaceae bacterium]|nr:threonine/serine exporter family protein [Casimicrobiaceae bacterium]